MHQKSC